MKNIFQTFNAGVMLVIFSTLLLSAKDQFVFDDDNIWSVLSANKELIAFGIFFLILKIKITFDDHKHFGEDIQTERIDGAYFRKIGFYLAAFSWFFWLCSAISVVNVHRAAGLLALALAISTAWIIVHIIEIWHYSKNKYSNDAAKLILQNAILELRKFWVISNIIYIIFLTLCFNQLTFVFFNYEITTIHFLLCCNLVLLVDMFMSDPI